MTPRFLLTSIAAVVAIMALPAWSQTETPPAHAPGNATTPAFALPQHNCVAPPYPSKERTEHLKGDAYNKAIEAFNRDYKAYGECVKKYVEDTKALIKAATEATNKAIEDYNKYNTDIKELAEADKK